MRQFRTITWARATSTFCLVVLSYCCLTISSWSRSIFVSIHIKQRNSNFYLISRWWYDTLKQSSIYNNEEVLITQISTFCALFSADFQTLFPYHRTLTQPIKFTVPNIPLVMKQFSWLCLCQWLFGSYIALWTLARQIILDAKNHLQCNTHPINEFFKHVLNITLQFSRFSTEEEWVFGFSWHVIIFRKEHARVSPRGMVQ